MSEICSEGFQTPGCLTLCASNNAGTGVSSDVRAVKLSNGEELVVRSFECPIPGAAGSEILRFLEEAFETQDLPFDRIVSGELEDTMYNVFYSGEIDAEMVASSWYAVSRSAPDIGVFGEVFTKPEHRGKGIAFHLTSICAQDFVSRGGEALYLATENPSAARVYAKAGYEEYSGHVMRYLVEPAPSFDDLLFRNTGRAVTRPAVWGDLPKVVALCVYPHTCFLRDYPSRSVSSRYAVQERCVSLFWPMWRDGEAAGGRFDVLESPEKRVVGLSRIVPDISEERSSTLDFVVHESYRSQASELIDYTVAGALESGTETIRLYLASCDQDKIDVAREAGFRPEGKLPDPLVIEGHRCDVLAYSYGVR